LAGHSELIESLELIELVVVAGLILLMVGAEFLELEFAVLLVRVEDLI
jgi:hypothetical protein